ncbi:hypothetical protein [Candidiatus Paracoxiella cheracis]|uniref:hypothetical protein n=1 Tax=Candidiatus Paracoxiella cheracis TaxID=3405120 RepID=UPI003BF5138C
MAIIYHEHRDTLGNFFCLYYNQHPTIFKQRAPHIPNKYPNKKGWTIPKQKYKVSNWRKYNLSSG